MLFGTDEIPPDRAAYEIYFRFMETPDECFSYSSDDPPGSGRWPISALDLPGDVLRQVYADNAGRLVPALGGPPGNHGRRGQAVGSATARRSRTPATCRR